MKEPTISSETTDKGSANLLEGCAIPGDYGDLQNGPGVLIVVRTGLSICELETWPDNRSAAAKAAKATQRVTGLGLRQASDNLGDNAQRFLTSPTNWTLVSSELEMPQRLAVAAGKNGRVTNRTELCCVMRVSGPNAIALVTDQFALDLAPETFPVGKGIRLATPAFANLQMQRVAEDKFDFIAANTEAQAFWQELTNAADTFGCRVG